MTGRPASPWPIDGVQKGLVTLRLCFGDDPLALRRPDRDVVLIVAYARLPRHLAAVGHMRTRMVGHRHLAFGHPREFDVASRGGDPPVPFAIVSVGVVFWRWPRGTAGNKRVGLLIAVDRATPAEMVPDPTARRSRCRQAGGLARGNVVIAVPLPALEA